MSNNMGDVVICQATFKDLDTTNNVTPGNVEGAIKNPNGDITTPPVTNPAPGIYQMRVVPDIPGQWSFSFSGLEPNKAAGENTFQVYQSKFPVIPAPVFPVPELLWIDGSDINTLFQDDSLSIPVTQTDDPIRSIEDKSGANNHLIMPAGVNSATYQESVYNGLSIVRLGSSCYFRTSFEFMNSPEFTLYAAFNSGSSGPDTLFNDYGDQGASSALILVGGINGVLNVRVRDSEGEIIEIINGDSTIFNVTSMKLQGVNLTRTLNNIPQIASNPNYDTTTIWTAPTVGTPPTVGAFTGGNSNYLTGDIGELMIYNRALGGSEENIVMDYLTRWGTY